MSDHLTDRQMAACRWLRRVATALGAVAVLGVGLAASLSAADEPQRLPFEPLTIETSGGAVDFSVEVARTEQERTVGLMHRTELPPDQGMLFDFGLDREVVMWMRNTQISLDMLFITHDGTIVRISEKTTPLSERRIPSGRPVRSVLELAAGSAARLGIAPGDRVRHPLFDSRS